MHPGLESIRQWILARNPELPGLDPDHELIDSRLIDSLSFVEFIILVEELSGRTLDVATLDLDDFRSLASIERGFFTGAQPAPLP
ncbi:acyl carrier protein [Sphaerisporangium perillae]|uniref:acyl carrier protein n=1 Tax=Sphaerisporangium perillae TaxID=2935860 RepID=UPI00200C037B|nr:acyl carrier protein [Sphaerisporangium perillae]